MTDLRWRLDQIVGVKEAARGLPALIDRHEPVVLTRRGDAQAVLVPLEEYENGAMPIAFARDLLAVCRRLLAAYEAEESEHGFPFNFALREAHRELADFFPKIRTGGSE